MNATPLVDAMMETGSWNPAWDAATQLDRAWMEDFVRMGTSAWRRNVLDEKTLELIAIAVDAACTHLYAPGTRRHIARALDVGATPEEILGVLQAVVSMGIHSVALGAPILLDEMKTRGLDMPASRQEK